MQIHEIVYIVLIFSLRFTMVLTCYPLTAEMSEPRGVKEGLPLAVPATRGCLGAVRAEVTALGADQGRPCPPYNLSNGTQRVNTYTDNPK